MSLHESYMEIIKNRNQYFYENYEVLEEIKSTRHKVLIRNKYGTMRVAINNVINGGLPNIRSALNKTEYLLNQLIEMNPDYYENEIEFIGTYKNHKTKILCKDKYGLIMVKPDNLLRGQIPDVRSAVDKNNYIINRFKEIHGEKFDYSKVQYTTNDKKIIVTCKGHGDFETTALNHINSKICCPVCREEHFVLAYESRISNLTDDELRKLENNRATPEYRSWVKNVFERDKYICQSCGYDKGGTLNAHHKDGHNWCEERRLDIDNGVTLCSDCHKDFHGRYGYGNNTEEQYLEWTTI